MTDTMERIAAIVSTHTETTPATITPASVIDELGADSFDRIEIGFDCEDQFGIIISDGELDEVATVDDLARLVDSKRRVS